MFHLEKDTDNCYERGGSYIPAARAQHSGEDGQRQRLAAGRADMQSARQDLNGAEEQPTATQSPDGRQQGQAGITDPSNSWKVYGQYI